MVAGETWGKLKKKKKKKIKVANFEGSNNWLKQVLEREKTASNYLLSTCLLPPFS